MTDPVTMTITINAVVPEHTRIDVGVLLVLQQAADKMQRMPGTKRSHIARAARWLAESYEAGEGEVR